MKPGHRLSPVRSSIVETAAIETGAALFAGCHLDRWLGYITDIMINQLGKAVLRRLRVRPHLVDGHEICRIDVPALSTPTYQTISKTERLLWERLPNSTRAVKDDEVTEFLQDRFGRSTGDLADDDGDRVLWLRPVNLREEFKREDRDFTPWLAQEVDLREFGSRLGMDLSLKMVEMRDEKSNSGTGLLVDRWFSCGGGGVG